MNAPARKRVCHILHFADGGRLLIMAIRKPRPSRLLLRLVHRAQSWIAASISVLASVFFAGAQAQVAPTALPTDGRVVSGRAAVSQAGARMDISQSSTKAILNWGSFNIGAQAQVNFAQPGSTAVALNRVLSSDPSQIYGKLSANGQVFLLNPNGVLFGPSARVDVGGMVASTLAIKDSDFLAGNYRFTRDGATGTIVNQGTLTAAEGGYVALLAPEVRNQGVIQATLGTVALAGGDALTLKFNEDAPLSVAVDPATVESLIENQNLVRADGGTVIMSAKAADELAGAVIQAGGIIAADSLQSRNGQIVLDAGNNGAIEISGALSAQGNGTGGRIDLAADTLNNRGEVSARAITLTGNDILQQGRIAAPGGSVTMTVHDTTYLDGVVDVSDPQGTGGRIWLTTATLEGMKGGSLRADGQQGGRIYVQGSGMVGFSSTFSATGTAQGGSIEVTGDVVYLLNADVDASGGDKGGIVHLGGGWQGSGELPHAREVLVGVGSEVKANAASTGAGGEVVVWSSQSSEHYGSLQATDGGRIELSSQGEIRQTGDLQAGPGGTVLFDPKNLVVTNGPPDSLALATKLVSGSLSGQPNVVGGDWFGRSVALEGDLLAVGAPSNGGTGAVYLFSGVGADFSGLTWRRKLSSGSGAAGMPLLGTGDGFGRSVALSRDLLAVGAPYDDSGCQADCGAVYLYNGVGSDFSGLTYRRTISSNSALANMPVPANGAFFGMSVALDDARLAVGAPRDGSSMNPALNHGVVYLFNGAETNFLGLAFRSTLTSSAGAAQMRALPDYSWFGYSVALDGDRLVVGDPHVGPVLDSSGPGSVHLFSGVGADYSGLTWRKVLPSPNGASGMPALENNDWFGLSASLNGDRLVVGAPFGDASTADRGSVYLFNGVGTEFSALSFLRKLGSGTVMLPTVAGAFGRSVALDGDRLAVGAPLDNSGGAEAGALYLFTGISTLPIGTSDALYTANPSADSYITPATLTRLLNVGTAVTLQANNDITVLSPVAANNPYGNGGTLTLQAGREIAFSAAVTTDNGNLTAVAGDSGANPNYRETGTPTLTIANGVSLNVGTGTATLAAVDGTFFNYAGNAAISTTGAGRWLIYARDPRTSVEGVSTYNKHYNQPYTSGSPPPYAASGNWFLYSVAPTLSVTPSSQTITYGEATPTAFAPNYRDSDFIPGDNAATAGLSGAASWAVAGPVSTSGHLTAGTHDVSYTGGLASSLGYQFVDNTASSNELAVNGKLLAVTANDAATTYSGQPFSGGNGVTYAGLVPGETSAVLGGTLTYGGTSQGAINVGNYTIVPSGLSSGNYVISYVDGTLTIGRADLIVTANDANTTYTGQPFIGGNGVTYSGFVNGETPAVLSGTLAYGGTSQGAINAGNYTIVPSGLSSGNYVITYVDGTLTIGFAARPLTVTANDSNTIYSGQPFSGGNGVTYSGFVNGETSAVLGGTLAYGGTSQGAINAGSYTIIPSGLASGNYVIRYVNGSLVIAPAALTITAVDHRVRFSGNPYSGGNGVSYAGFVSGEDSRVLTGTLVYGGTSQGAVVPGTYTISPLGLTAANYVISYVDGTLFLEPQESSVPEPHEPHVTTPTDPMSHLVTRDPVESYPSGTDVGESPIPGPGEGESEASGEGDATAGEGSEGSDRLAALAYVEAARHQARTELYKDALEAIREDSTIADVPECDEDKSQERQELCIPKVAAADKVPASAQSPSEPKGGSSAEEPEHKVALLFGNNAYKGRIRRLDTPVRDMNAIGKVLRSSMGYEVKVVENATKRDMIEELVALSKRVARDDSVLVMYAGHGYEMNDTKQGFWLPVDASPSDAKSWVSNNDIYKLLKVIPAKQIILISDSCFSGTLTKEQKLGAIGTKKDILGRRSVVAMSSGDETPVADVGLEKHSIFAYHLIKQLGGTVTEQVASQLLDTMRAEVRKFYPQVPQIGGVISAGHVIGGDYLFLPKE